MTGITPERLAGIRNLAELMDWQLTVELLDEIDRLRAVIRETHRECGVSHTPNQRHMHGCKLYEIEP